MSGVKVNKQQLTELIEYAKKLLSGTSITVPQELE